MRTFTAPSKNIFTSQLARGRICSECARRDHLQCPRPAQLSHKIFSPQCNTATNHPRRDFEFPHNRHRPSTTITGLHVHQTAPPVIFHSPGFSVAGRRIRMLNHACDSFTLRGARAIYSPGTPRLILLSPLTGLVSDCCWDSARE